MITYEFQVKSKSEIQWEIWEIDIIGHLEMVVGANGIALSYVICQNSILSHSHELMWDEKSRLSAPHTGNKYNLDAQHHHTQNLGNLSRIHVHQT